MPREVNGIQLVAQAPRRQPTLKVLPMSGYTVGAPRRHIDCRSNFRVSPTISSRAARGEPSRNHIWESGREAAVLERCSKKSKGE
jgi:hypothetical protein